MNHLMTQAFRGFGLSLVSRLLLSRLTILVLCFGGVLCAVTQAANAAPVEQPTLFVFTATWCGPCQVDKPIIKQIEKTGKVKVVYFDMDNPKHKAYADACGITGIPVYIIIRTEGTKDIQVFRSSRILQIKARLE